MFVGSLFFLSFFFGGGGGGGGGGGVGRDAKGVTKSCMGLCQKSIKISRNQFRRT